MNIEKKPNAIRSRFLNSTIKQNPYESGWSTQISIKAGKVKLSIETPRAPIRAVNRPRSGTARAKRTIRNKWNSE